MKDLSGTVLDDRYRLERLLGEGGMGQVYQGRHEITGRAVAVKILLPEYADNKEVVERFYREAKAATAVGNEHICEVLDMRPQHMGTPYLVMEYLDGETLKERIRRTGPLTPNLAAAIFRQILEGLAAAHDARIIHRDMKPENVFLVPRLDGPPHVKLLDFGISKFSDGSEDHALTLAGTILGSPYYMSPEQANGEAKVGPLSDLYSVGVMLHEALTGAVPFDAPTFSALVIKIVTEVPPHASDLDPRIPRELGNLVRRAMARSVNNRFRSAREMAAALANMPIVPDQPSREIPSTLIPASRKRSGDRGSDPFAVTGVSDDPDFPPAGATGLGEPPPTEVTGSVEHQTARPVGPFGLPEPEFPPARAPEEDRPTDPQAGLGQPGSAQSAQQTTEGVSEQLPASEQSFDSRSGTFQPSHSSPSYNQEVSSPSFSLMQPTVMDGSSASFVVVKDDGRTPMTWPQGKETKRGPGKVWVVLGIGTLLFALFAASGLAVVFIGLPMMEERAPAPPIPVTPVAPRRVDAPPDPGRGDASPSVVANVHPGDAGPGGDSGAMVEAGTPPQPGGGDAGPVVETGAPADEPVPSEDQAGRTVRIVIRATPASARIFLNGREIEGNPAEVTLPADAAVHEVEARAQGYRNAESRFTANEDREIELSLQRRQRSHRPRKVGPGGLINPWD